MNLKQGARFAIGLILIIWIIFALDALLPGTFTNWGVIPRHLVGLRGVLFHTLLHADLPHILANSMPLLILTFLLQVTYPRRAVEVLVSVTLLSGMLIWILARPASHLGASSLIYGLSTYLITAGFLSRNPLRVIIAGLVLVFYSGLWIGMLPGTPHVSWEGHLLGAFSGVLLAWLHRSRSA